VLLLNGAVRINRDVSMDGDIVAAIVCRLSSFEHFFIGGRRTGAFGMRSRRYGASMRHEWAGLRQVDASSEALRGCSQGGSALFFSAPATPRRAICKTFTAKFHFFTNYKPYPVPQLPRVVEAFWDNLSGCVRAASKQANRSAERHATSDALGSCVVTLWAASG
jgi:hypothetical protein